MKRNLIWMVQMIATTTSTILAKIKLVTPEKFKAVAALWCELASVPKLKHH
jgi:hypothetical protein